MTPVDSSSGPDSTPIPTDKADAPTVELRRWDGPWDADDPDANFKHDVALYTKLDPLETLTNLSTATGVPVGALCRYVLAKWTSAGAEALLALGPSAVLRLQSTMNEAEAADSDEARLAAYQDVRSQLDWLAVPLSPDT